MMRDPRAEKLIDISPLVSARIRVWPGDVPYHHEESLDIAHGDNLTLGAVHTTLHVGAHADAPRHYVRDGQDIASRALDPYYGPCQVVAVTLPRGERIRPSDCAADIVAPRLLFRTDLPDPTA
jgi:arylformamidase